MRKFAVALGLTVAGVSVVGCGNANSEPVQDPTAMVGTGTAAGVGTVLVDAHGMVLYYSDQDTGGRPWCTGSCTSVWLPAVVTRPAVPPGSPPGVTLVRRPDDGRWQLAYRDRPLYEFRMDGMAGVVNGNGVHDRFGGTDFTWQVATVGPVAH